MTTRLDSYVHVTTLGGVGCEHVWEPEQGECGVYRCECGASGYRSRRGIRAHRKPLERLEQPDVLEMADECVEGGGRVSRKRGAE